MSGANDETFDEEDIVNVSVDEAIYETFKMRPYPLLTLLSKREGLRYFKMTIMVT